MAAKPSDNVSKWAGVTVRCNHNQIKKINSIPPEYVTAKNRQVYLVEIILNSNSNSSTADIYNDPCPSVN